MAAVWGWDFVGLKGAGKRMRTHLAISIVASDGEEALAKARTLPSQVTLAEYRLDLMARVDVAQVAHETPVPAIFTCRPTWEGGHFQGSERERLEILAQALETGHWVDVEWKTLAKHPQLARRGKVIASMHNFKGMLTDWSGLERQMRSLGAQVVKLVGMARDEEDALPPLAWLAQARGPAVAIAMGAAGVATRLLAPRFPRAFLTFASLDQATAPGQVTVHEWVHRFGFIQTWQADPLLVLLTPDPIPWDAVDALRDAVRARLPHRRPWILPIPSQRMNPHLRAALRLAGAEEIAI